MNLEVEELELRDLLLDLEKLNLGDNYHLKFLFPPFLHSQDFQLLYQPNPFPKVHVQVDQLTEEVEKIGSHWHWQLEYRLPKSKYQPNHLTVKVLQDVPNLAPLGLM